MLVVNGMNACSFCVHWPIWPSAVSRVLGPNFSVVPALIVQALLLGGVDASPYDGPSTVEVLGAW